MAQYKQIFTNGLWKQNPGLIQFLGICPLLAVSNSVVNGIGLGIATLLVLLLSNVTVSILRPMIAAEIRLPVFVLIIATLVTCVELLTKSWFFSLWQSLGIFLPLIVTNCVILARAEAFAARQQLIPAIVDAIGYGLGFAAVLILLGAIREIVGTGSLFANAEMLFGPAFSGTELQLFGQQDGFLLALLPPGAFLGLALLMVCYNLVEQRAKRASTDTAPVIDS
jgi:electron transport complex protein RnfE